MSNDAPRPEDAVDFHKLPDLCVPSEVAQYFRVAEYTVKKWLRSGKAFPNAFKVSGSWRIPKEDVKAYAVELFGDRSGDRSARRERLDD